MVWPKASAQPMRLSQESPEMPGLWSSAASHAGMRAVDGLGMLAWQGILAFALWTGHTPPAGPVLTALRAAAASIDTR